MAKSKSKERREKIQTESKSDKHELVQSVEKITGISIDSNPGGKDYIREVKLALNKKGFDITVVKSEDGTVLQVISVQGKPQFQSVVKEKGKITFDPSGDIDKKTKYQVVASYEITERQKVEAKTDSEE